MRDIKDESYETLNGNRYFGPGGNFVVLKENILRRPKIVYEQLYHWLISFPDGSPHGHLMERFWPAIFSSHCASGKYDSCFYHQGSLINRKREKHYEPPIFLIDDSQMNHLEKH
jgi:hypothetical protein